MAAENTYMMNDYIHQNIIGYTHLNDYGKGANVSLQLPVAGGLNDEKSAVKN